MPVQNKALVFASNANQIDNKGKYRVALFTTKMTALQKRCADNVCCLKFCIVDSPT